MTVMPDYVYVVPQAVLDDTRQFLHACGREGCEGMALWPGVSEASGTIHITRVIVPEQNCHKTPLGLYVEMTEQAHLTLPDQLQGKERFYIRIHSHPRRAYHSERDDQNFVLTHQGALSIVVPNFATAPLDLQACAIYRLRHAVGWEPLSKLQITQYFQVTP